MIAERPFPKGPQLHLRPLTKADAAGPYLEWINDLRVKRYLAARFDRLGVADIERYMDAVNAEPAEVMLAACDNCDAKHVGNVKLQNINHDHGTAVLSVVIGDTARWGRGLGTESIALMTEFAFERLGLRRIDAGCFAANKGAVRAFLKCGYKQEGLARGLYVLDERAWDAVRLGLLDSDPPLWKLVLGRESVAPL